MAMCCARTTRWPKTPSSAFLKKYPNDRRAADAQFWLGESLFQRQRYDAAAQPSSTSPPSTRVTPRRRRRCCGWRSRWPRMKQKEMACATLAEVGRKYPNATTTVKQGVEREQKRVRC